MALGYYPWAPSAYYSQSQGVSIGQQIYLSNVPGLNTNHSSCPPGAGNPNWIGPFSLEEVLRNLQNTKADAT